MASQSYYYDIDLEKVGVLKNARMNPVTTSERTTLGASLSSSHKGLLAWDTTLSTAFFWDGSDWVSISGGVGGLGDVTAASNLTDNNLVRGDGGTKGVQTSGWILYDDNELALTYNGTNQTGLYVSSSGDLARSINGEAEGEGAFGVVGNASGLNAAGVMASRASATSNSLVLRGQEGWDCAFNFTVDASANRKWEIPDDTATPNIMASRGWVSSTFTGSSIVSGDHPSDVVDNRIAGLTANNSTKLVYSTQDHATPSYVRSTTCWGTDLDLTCASPWNSGNVNLWAGTAITPRHIVMAQHAFVVNGSTIRFIASDNTIITRTLSSAVQVGSTDIRIGLLDSDLPSTITPAKLLPDDWARWMTVPGTACFYLDQEEKLLVAEIDWIGATSVSIRTPLDAQRLTFYETPIDDDSGNPVFANISGDTVLLFCFLGNDNGPTLIANNRAGVLSAIATLGAFGHAPVDVSFPVGIDAIALRNQGSLVIAASQVTTGVFDTDRLGTGGTGGTTRFLREDGAFEPVSGAGLGDVSASSNFSTDNRLIRSDGVVKGVQASLWTLDDAGTLQHTYSDVGLQGIYVLSEGYAAYSINGEAIGEEGFGIVGAASGLNGAGVLAWQAGASANALTIRNDSGFNATFNFTGTANRAWQVPDDNAASNIVASRRWTSQHGAISWPLVHWTPTTISGSVTSGTQATSFQAFTQVASVTNGKGRLYNNVSSGGPVWPGKTGQPDFSRSCITRFIGLLQLANHADSKIAIHLTHSGVTTHTSFDRSDKGFSIVITGGVTVQAVIQAHNGSSTTNSTPGTFASGDDLQYISLEWESGVAARLYRNGVLITTLSTGLPTGLGATSSGGVVFVVENTTNGTGATLLRLGNLEVAGIL